MTQPKSSIDTTDWTWGRAAQVFSVVLAVLAIIWSVAGRDHNIQAFPRQIAENAAAAKDAKMAAEASAKEANAKIDKSVGELRGYIDKKFDDTNARIDRILEKLGRTN